MANVTFDYDSIRSRLIKSLKSKVSWAQILPYSTNTRLIDVVAESIAELAEYDEYLTRETKWKLAQNRSSLVNQADVLSYVPARNIAAKGELRVSTSENVVESTVRRWDETTGYNIDDYVVHDDGDNSRYYKADATILPTDEDDPNTSPDQSSDWSRIDKSHSVNIEIPKYSIFSNGGDLKVTTVNKFVLSSDDDYIDIDVIQGIPKTETREALGVNYEEFEFDNSKIDNEEYAVFVNGIEWSEVDDLRLADSSDTSYEIFTKADGQGVILRFGNGVFGKSLSNGDDVKFQYVETNGLSGNITSINTINEVVSTFYDVNGDQVDLFCINDDTIGGGKNIEDKEEIRTNGPRIFQTGGRATSAEDYVSILEDYDYVSKAVAWGAYEYNIDNNNSPGTFVPSEENVVHIAAFTTAGEELTQSQKDDIREYINTFKAPTDIIKFEDVSFINLIFNVTAHVRDHSYTLSTVQNNIIEGLKEEYDINNRDFAENLYKSDYISFIDGIEGVFYHNTSIQLFELIEFESGYATSWNFALFPLVKESIKVYIKLKESVDPNASYELVARDNGLGGFVGQNGYSATGSSVNYDFGTGSLTLTNSDSDKLDQFYTNYDIKVVYSIEDENFELSRRSQVLKYDDTNITIQYMQR